MRLVTFSGIAFVEETQVRTMLEFDGLDYTFRVWVDGEPFEATTATSGVSSAVLAQAIAELVAAERRRC